MVDKEEDRVTKEVAVMVVEPNEFRDSRSANHDVSDDVNTYSPLRAVNPASVPQRSPFRYPGGKTWLVPLARKWLGSRDNGDIKLIEPFAGGAIIGLTAAFEGLAHEVTLVEIDPDIAAVWRTILYGDGVELANRYAAFEPSPESVEQAMNTEVRSLADRAFLTLLRNRISRGGVIAPGAGILRRGENGKGLASRWYPETIRKRILGIIEHRDRIKFIQGDGLSYMEAHLEDKRAVWFLDPPYSGAGKRLYTYSDIDHEYLFHLANKVAGDFLMTYEESEEVKMLAKRYNFQVRHVQMRNTHHESKAELLIGRSLHWADS